MGTLNLFESIVELELKSSRIMLASSTAAYGFIDPLETPVTEEQPFRPAHVYGVSKAAQDLLGFTYFSTYGLDIIRPVSYTHLDVYKRQDRRSLYRWNGRDGLCLWFVCLVVYLSLIHI